MAARIAKVKPKKAAAKASTAATKKSVPAKKAKTASAKKARPPKKAPPAKKQAAGKAVPQKPRLLSGGNPQIAKAAGDAPVQAYIDALPGWKGDVGRWLDGLIVRAVPGVKKAIKWNTPFYGVDGRGWFLGVHAFKNHMKVAFFRGTSLVPLPPGESTGKEVRYLDIREPDPRDDAQLVAWVKQAAALPGWLG